MSISMIDSGALRSSWPSDEMSADTIARFEGLADVMRANSQTKATLSPEGIFAHAPETFVVHTGTAEQLNLEFGMRAGNYESFGTSDGVCFFVGVRDSQERLLERCVDPKTVPEHSDPQSVKIAVPPHSVVELRTECRTNCNYDWSYWGRVDLR